MLCIVLLLYGVKYFFTWDGWQIVRAYVKAKKEGICPLVTFVDPDSPESGEEDK